MDEVLTFLPLITLLLVSIIAIVSSLIMSLVYGAMIGAIPLMASFLTGEQKNLGIIGAIVCVALYLVIGFFWAMAACLIFTFLVLKGLKKAAPAQDLDVEAAAVEE